MRSVPKELLQLCCHHQCQACTQVPHARDFWKFATSEKLPFPRSGYRHRATLDLWSAPVQGITIMESSRRSSVSQLRHSHPVSLLCLQNVLAQSQDCANVLHNLKIGIQFPDSENVQHNLEIAQIPRLRGTHIHPTQTGGMCVCRI